MFLMSLLAVGCSSGRPAAARHRPSTTRSTATQAVAAAAATNAKQAAVALGHRMLNQAVFPPGAHVSNGSVPTVLAAPGSLPAMGNLVYGRRVWALAEPPSEVYRWLQAHVPSGYAKDSTDSGIVGGVRLSSVEDRLSAEPSNISYAELEFGIAPDALGRTVVRIDTVVGWTDPRPADEFVGARDQAVILTVVHVTGPVVKRVVATDANLVQPIVRAFNQMRVYPPDVQTSCPPMGPDTVSYHLGFLTSPYASPDLVASIGACGGVGITIDGHPGTALEDLDATFRDAVAHLLGLLGPHFG